MRAFLLAVDLSNEVKEPAYILQRENGEYKVSSRKLHELESNKMKLLTTVFPGIK